MYDRVRKLLAMGNIPCQLPNQGEPTGGRIQGTKKAQHALRLLVKGPIRHWLRRCSQEWPKRHEAGAEKRRMHQTPDNTLKLLFTFEENKWLPLSVRDAVGFERYRIRRDREQDQHPRPDKA